MKEEAYRLKKGIQARGNLHFGVVYAFQSIVSLAHESGNGTVPAS